LRIPFSSSKTGLVCVERAELIVPGAAPSAPTAISSSAPAAKAAGEAPSAPAQKTPASATEPVEATCPVCLAHLRFDPKKSSDSHNPPTAELVHHNKLSPGATPAPAPAHVEHCDTQHTQHQHLSFE